MAGLCSGGPRPLGDLGAIESRAGRAIALVGAKVKPEFPGGAFGILDVETGLWVIRPTIIGTVVPEKIQDYLDCCAEKAIRLSVMNIYHDHVLSHQSACEGRRQYGGAVYDNSRYIFTFSAFPPAGDEAVNFLVANWSGRMTRESAMGMAKLSKNDVLEEAMFLKAA